MITIRKSLERGHAEHGWLDSWHTFSFADYYDPAHMGFRALRVINEDRVRPSMGFDAHQHRDMEIISYVVEGALEHKDSLGNHGVIRSGEVQRMSAGTGVIHSEFNPSATEPVHFFQIWILPDTKGIAPGYEQKFFREADKRGCLRLIASPDGRDGSLTIHQDTLLFDGLIEPGKSVTYGLSAGRSAWIQVVRGKVTINGHALNEGDGASTSDEYELSLSAATESEVLLFDLS